MRARSACTRARAQLPPLWITKKYRVHCSYNSPRPFLKRKHNADYATRLCIGERDQRVAPELLVAAAVLPQFEQLAQRVRLLTDASCGLHVHLAATTDRSEDATRQPGQLTVNLLAASTASRSMLSRTLSANFSFSSTVFELAGSSTICASAPDAVGATSSELLLPAADESTFFLLRALADVAAGAGRSSLLRPAAASVSWPAVLRDFGAEPRALRAPPPTGSPGAAVFLGINRCRCVDVSMCRDRGIVRRWNRGEGR